MDKNQFDIIIVGGGAAGMMAAYSAKLHHPEKSVAILDGSYELGRKLCIAGAGRGNLTNRHITENPSTYFYGNSAFVERVFSQCGYEKIINFFTTIGIPTHEEAKSGKGKIFPVIEHAKTVRDIIVTKLKEVGVKIYVDTRVISLTQTNGAWAIETKTTEYQAKHCILTTGGQTYPALGSDGSGFDIARKLGHTIIPPVPSAVPLIAKNSLSHFLQGEKIEMGVKVMIDGKEIDHTIRDVLFTHYGLSGSAILEVSRQISVRIHRDKKHDVEIVLSFFPEKSRDEIDFMVQERWVAHPEYPVSRSLWGFLTTKAAGAVCAVAKISRDQTVDGMTKDEKNAIISILSNYRITIENTRGWNEAEFTAGGIDTKDIDEATLASKKTPHLYFAGEIIDVDGMIGGYNLSFAWASGYIAGKNILHQLI